MFFVSTWRRRLEVSVGEPASTPKLYRSLGNMFTCRRYGEGNDRARAICEGVKTTRSGAAFAGGGEENGVGMCVRARVRERKRESERERRTRDATPTMYRMETIEEERKIPHLC